MFKKLYKRLKNKIRLLQNKGKEPYLSLSKLLGFYPDNIKIYEQALLHKSSSVETTKGHWANNERLEFLGDALLDSIVGDIVYRRYPNKQEGFLTNARSKLVQRETLNKIAVQMRLDRLVVYSTRITTHNNYMYGNALEALIGAIYLDQGYDLCYQFVRDEVYIKNLDIDELTRQEMNFKSCLIEWAQKHKIPVAFNVIESFMDSDGNQVFQSGVSLLEKEVGVGVGYSKKESQQAACKMAIRRLRSDQELQQQFLDREKKPVSSKSYFKELPHEDALT